MAPSLHKVIKGGFVVVLVVLFTFLQILLAELFQEIYLSMVVRREIMVPIILITLPVAAVVLASM